MSSTIWTRCAASSSPRRLSARPFRVVEAQHVVSTRKLVDSLEEQVELERLIDRHKPAAPHGDGFEGLHYLFGVFLNFSVIFFAGFNVIFTDYHLLNFIELVYSI